MHIFSKKPVSKDEHKTSTSAAEDDMNNSFPSPYSSHSSLSPINQKLATPTDPKLLSNVFLSEENPVCISQLEEATRSSGLLNVHQTSYPPPYKTSMDAISNPLGLLAEVSEAEFQSPNTGQGSSMDMSRIHPLSSSLQSKLTTLLHGGEVDPRLSKLNLDHEVLLNGLQYLASPDQASSNAFHDINTYQIHQCRTVRDIGSELDPIECAVLSERESVYLYDMYAFFCKLLNLISPSINTRTLPDF